MPKVEKLPSGSYRVRFTDQHGRRQSITAPTAADTRARYKRTIGDMARGDYIDPRRGRTTLAAWADDWLTGARNVGPGGADMYRQALAHILPNLGRTPLAAIDAAQIDRYLTGKLDELAPSTVHRHYRTLHRLFAVAVQRGMIPRNPCEHVHPPKVPRTEFTVLDPTQIDALADALTAVPKGKRQRKNGGPLDSRYRAWVYVAAYGGLRWSETVGLRRRNVDGPAIRVVDQLVRRRDKTWDRCEPKVGSRRTVTLPSFAADELAGHLERYTLPGPDGLVFPTRNGTAIQGPSWTSNTFKRALVRAGLPDIRVHDLRHTAVALAIEAGAHPKAVQERMGHASIKTTLDTYGHLFDAADEQVADGLDSLRAKAQRGRLRAV